MRALIVIKKIRKKLYRVSLPRLDTSREDPRSHLLCTVRNDPRLSDLTDKKRCIDWL